MIFTPCPLAGAFLVDLQPHADGRGFFARAYCGEEFAAQGIEFTPSQCSVSFNERRGTLRGMHYQADPHAEDKLVRCTAGAVFDVIVDLRSGSATHRAWFGATLSARNRRALYVPRGCAHGFVSLTHNAELFYLISTPHVPQLSRGFKWNDPAVGIEWPLRPAVISERDDGYPPLGAV